MLAELLDLSATRIRNTTLDFRRFLFDQINWKDRLIGIKGARGTGKTTLVLQCLKSLNLPSPVAAYLSLDELYFTTHTIIETVKTFYHQGGEILALDEVHKYPGWAREIKNLYDRYPNLKIIFTGSSIIDIAKEESDLSRRAILYELPGLSYREYLAYHHKLYFPALKIEQIFSSGSGLRALFPSGFKPLIHFRDYLVSGYYPFSFEYPETYKDRLRQITRTIVESDMAELQGFDIRQAKKMLQLLYIIAQQVPFKPNINSLADKTKLHRNTIPNYLHFLERARLIDLLYPSGRSVAVLQKPEKIYLQNTNLLYAFSETTPSQGTIREVFFNSQTSIHHRLHYSPYADFEINGTWHFEVGGKSKSGKQIQGIDNAWIVGDDVEFPSGKTLPLWIFGFLY